MGKVDFYPDGSIEHFIYYMERWPKNVIIYEISVNDDIYKENMWQILIRTKKKIFIITNTQDLQLISKLKKVTHEKFIEIIKDYEDDNFIIYVKQLDSDLIGYLIDFFKYYVKLPDKIKSFEDDNIIFFQNLNKKYY